MKKEDTASGTWGDIFGGVFKDIFQMRFPYFVLLYSSIVFLGYFYDSFPRTYEFASYAHEQHWWKITKIVFFLFLTSWSFIPGMTRRFGKRFGLFHTIFCIFVIVTPFVVYYLLFVHSPINKEYFDVWGSVEQRVVHSQYSRKMAVVFCAIFSLLFLYSVDSYLKSKKKIAD